MNIERQIERRKAAYVQAISDSLVHLPEADREAVLEDVEDHIDSALYEGAMVADLHRLEEVLSNLGPAEEYAADLTSRIGPGQVGPAKLCPLAVIGLTWSLCALFIALPAIFLMGSVRMSRDGDPIEESRTIGQWMFIVLAWLSLAGFIGGPTVSSIAIGKIRAARGALYGLQTAVIGLYLLPLFIVDAVLIGFGAHFLDNALKDSEGAAKSFIQLAAVIALLAWNVYVVRRATTRLKLKSDPSFPQ